MEYSNDVTDIMEDIRPAYGVGGPDASDCGFAPILLLTQPVQLVTIGKSFSTACLYPLLSSR